MDNLPENPSCALSGTKYCRILNMHACEQCTMRGRSDLDRVKADIDLYETLLPEGGIARLFSSRACQLCKGDEKRARSGYAILDMAHPEPKRVQKWLLGKRTTQFGTMIPVQLAVCGRCRRRYLWMEYLPIVCPVTLGAAGLLALALTDLGETLINWHAVAPFLAWAVLVLGGWLLGRAWSATLKKRSELVMYADVLTHPVVKEMLDKGWTPLARQSSTKLLFSRSRMARGLGTAEDAEETPEGSSD